MRRHRTSSDQDLDNDLWVFSLAMIKLDNSLGRRTGRNLSKSISVSSGQHDSIRFMMKSCDDIISNASKGGSLLRASEKVICHLFHLVVCFYNHSIFHDTEAKVSYIGEQIIMITVILALGPSKGLKIFWKITNGPLLEEVIVRNMHWTMKDSPRTRCDGKLSWRLSFSDDFAQTNQHDSVFGRCSKRGTCVKEENGFVEASTGTALKQRRYPSKRID
ncbi:hypothetical protein F5050DRAFT_881794 [Lentinula boryana]|uniref:Uncharacterized protein n=1 Tax=Lentinula boryana TaxID=40481 RepID=A0ABQ8Q1Y3_9AGAR|nr:hypothetical protein F5050DRAFT_881794 [Lentinula boryana]